MIEINIAKEFASETGARYYTDGPKSGQEFFEVMLRPRFETAIANNEQLRVILDGTEGLASSFLNEAFRLLGETYGAQKVRGTLQLVSVEIPKYIVKIEEALNESEHKH